MDIDNIDDFTDQAGKSIEGAPIMVNGYLQNNNKSTLRHEEGILFDEAIIKTTKNIKVSCYQLHSTSAVEAENPAGNLSRVYRVSSQEGALQNNYKDLSILMHFLAGEYPYMTEHQKRIADLSGNDGISYGDYVLLYSLIMGEIFQEDGEDGESDWAPTASLGDLNGDGFYNVVDIVLLVNFLFSNSAGEVSEEELNIALAFVDMNQDGLLNVLDIVHLVNYIFEN